MFRNSIKYWKFLTTPVLRVLSHVARVVSPVSISNLSLAWTTPNTLVKVYFASAPGLIPGGGTEGEGSRLRLYQGGEPAQIRL